MKEKENFYSKARWQISLMVSHLRGWFSLFFPPGTPPAEAGRVMLVVLALFFFTVMTAFNLQAATSWRQQLAERDKSLSSFEGKMKQFYVLEPIFSALRKDLPLLAVALPDSLEPSILLNKINLLFSKNQVKLRSIKMEKTQVGGKPYRTLLLDLSFQGSYPQVAQTLEDLEQDEQIFVMQSLLLRRLSVSTQIEGNLQINTYYYPMEAGL